MELTAQVLLAQPVIPVITTTGGTYGYPSSPPSSSPSSVTRHPDRGASTTSVGTAVSYPYPVPPPAAAYEDSEADGDGSSAPARRPTRMSLTLANWNPETDGDLFDAGSERGSVAPRRGAGGDAG